MSMPPNKRHYYEMIQEGMPCHLYFDIEFEKELNPGVDGNNLLEIFKDYVQFRLQNIFCVQICRNSIIDLDSSTITKFSRHLIFRIPGKLFADNLHVGSFVQNMVNDINLIYLGERQEDRKDALQKLYIKTKSGEKSLFIDEGVYTRNR